MDPTPWRELLRVGVEEIDAEHELIIQMMESLRDAMRTAGRDAVPDESARATLRKLLSYVRKHFEREEKLMRDAGYPDLASHKREHDLFLQYLETTEQTAFSGDAAAITELLNSLANWERHHVLEVDKYLGVYLLEKSVGGRHLNDEPPEPHGGRNG